MREWVSFQRRLEFVFLFIYLFWVGSYYVALAVFVTHYVDQASLKLTEIHLSLLPIAGIKGLHHHALLSTGLNKLPKLGR